MEKQKIINGLLRKDFKSFVVRVFKEVAPGSEYKDNWHIDVICDAAMDMMEGKNNRLIVNIPPRNLKSMICSIALPAFLLGRDPKTCIICISYSDDLASKFANDCRRVMQTAWYQRLFPATVLQTSRRAINDFETTKGGGRFATSIGGTLTGRGADWIIIDDPLKPADAASDLQREKVNEWYRTTLFSRLNDKQTGKIILIMQRLHQDDLTGYLLDSNAGFRHIKLPIIAEEEEVWPIFDRAKNEPDVFTRKVGELLHPAREDMSVVMDLKMSLGEIVFAGQYRQMPVPAEGGTIKKDWIHTYTELPKDFSHIKNPWDTASKTGENNAFSACIQLGIGKGIDGQKKIYVLNGIRDRLEFPDLIKLIEQIHLNIREKYSGAVVETLIEEASSGVSAVQLLKKNHPRLKFTSVRPTQDKKTRLINISPYIENGTILFPAEGGAWLKEFMTELLMFPATKFKDQVDAFSMGVESALEIINRPEMRVTVI
ncbi:MAG: phage terminase large subunit [Alphaproteobacteria bacterium]|nr:phage terminase large subunit [Alphaproteobacteria bacterium]